MHMFSKRQVGPETFSNTNFASDGRKFDIYIYIYILYIYNNSDTYYTSATLARCFQNRMASLVWHLSLGIVCLGTFACDLSLGNFRLGSFTYKRSFGIFRLGAFVWGLYLRISAWSVRLKMFALDLSLGTFAWTLSRDNFRSESLIA